uniref:Uncharacterized protein n=1 Tax=Arundo donax TaxID=35708 RepID=A0A0A9EBX8_ARUDO
MNFTRSYCPSKLYWRNDTMDTSLSFDHSYI